ncbi:ATP-binding protein [Streptomyces sp. H39-S7]|uniref:ATP-binding protein n=1 Tax=Streptomyces sp. H39-S7 TaxID=3004357 RepID=UPI0022AFEF33|nr:ATP-binding protein [Streptomyces sp. H39-S7]MCZ4126048.1 ATP-binding protein [Streptomyces sp. H39-S7]
MQQVPGREVRDEAAVVTTRWPSSPCSVGHARHMLEDVLTVWGLPELTEPAVLVISELMTNAVVHGRVPGRRVETRVIRLADGVRIEVHDANAKRPEMRQASEDDERGRGLALVQELTGGCWGVNTRQGVGKRVWAQLAADAGHPADSGITLEAGSFPVG